ncbi:unnamed protein product [Heterobilharzia americana]|nr:unnamed protein product [Heterobilharzia americana]
MSTNVNQPAHWSHYIQFIIFYYGCTGTRCWTALIALILLMERARSLCFVLRHQFYIYATGFITPAVAIIILLFTSSGQTVIDINPVFQYGTNQLIISLIVLVVNTAVTLGCLITFKRMEPPVHDCYEIRETSTEGNKPSDELSHQLNDESSTGQEIISLQHMEQATQSNSVVSATNTTSCSHCNPANCLTLFDCGDCPGGKQKSQQHRQQSCDYTGFCDYCNQKQRKECAKIIACYCENHQQSTSSSSSSVPPRNQQISLQSELDSILTHGNGICLCTWRLVHDAPTGIYVVLEFMDGCLNSGQGVILFVLFGLDTDLFIFPLKRFLTRWFSQFSGKLYHGTFLESLNKEKIDKNEIDKIVNQFVKFHLQSCSKRIGHKKIVNSIHYDNVFYHFALEDWLIAAGITNTHENATFYIKCLELGNIIVCISPLVNTSSMMMMMMIMSSSDSQRLLTFTNYAWDLQNITY